MPHATNTAKENRDDENPLAFFPEHCLSSAAAVVYSTVVQVQTALQLATVLCAIS